MQIDNIIIPSFSKKQISYKPIGLNHNCSVFPKDNLPVFRYSLYSIWCSKRNKQNGIESNKEKIELICEKPIIVFGSDVQGSTESIKANEVLHWRYFNTKKKYLHKYEVNDVAGLIKLYNSKKLINELKEKGLWQ